MEQRLRIPVGALELEIFATKQFSIDPGKLIYTLQPIESRITPVEIDGKLVPLSAEEEEFLNAYVHDNTPLEIVGWPRTTGSISISLQYIGSSHGKSENKVGNIDFRTHATDHPTIAELGRVLYKTINSDDPIQPTKPFTPHQTTQDLSALIAVPETQLPDAIQETYVRLNEPIPQFLQEQRTRDDNPQPKDAPDLPFYF